MIKLEGKSLQELVNLGIEIDHGINYDNKYYKTEASASDLNILKRNNVQFKVIVDDVEQAFVQNSGVRTNLFAPCVTSSYEIQTPVNYSYGTMGGYLTYDELVQEFNKMKQLYPNLISDYQPISDTILTHEGRTVNWLKVSNHPNTNESDKPEILYTALHHAREPNSLSQMVFYIWYLLENYESDEYVRFLVDNTELYFIPVVNPDGYIFNEMNSPEGGGMWRKNRRNNDDGSFGVDLNRNYGYEWGFNNSGSSPDGESETYRGSYGFSEPESRAVKFFSENHEFQFALNYHTFSNLLIYPWGYSEAATPDADVFQNSAKLLTSKNHYIYGFSSQTVGYAVNGTSDDWLYGDVEHKDKVFAMTPEVGTTGFWPIVSDIDRLNKENLFPNLALASFPHNYGQFTDLSDHMIATTSHNFNYELKRFGLKPGNLTVHLNPISENVSVGNDQTYQLNLYESTIGAIPFQITSADNDGLIKIEAVLSNGIVTIQRDTITFVIGNEEIIFSDDCQNMNNWSSSTWNVTNETFVSASNSITDSPMSNYDSNAYSEILITEPFDLTNVTLPQLQFWAKWALEPNYDYVQVQASAESFGNFQALCGKYTKSGSANQDLGNPLYDGFQNEWVLEQMDLSDFIGQEQVYVKFVIKSDNFQEEDGFYFDDLVVKVLDQTVQNNEESTNVEQFELFPNPTNGSLYLKSKNNFIGNINLVDVNGRMVFSKNIQHEEAIEINNLNSGVYFATFNDRDGKILKVQKIVKLSD
ncbi:MAG: immune inhibitor A [Saprospiraceae bacterium]|nr:immune inhibitor A [Saprospiraceae bacterium]